MGRYDGTEGVECIKAIRNALTYEEFRGFCKGNIIKYVWREAKKGFIADTLKAMDYAEYLIDADLEEHGAMALVEDMDITAAEFNEALRRATERGTDAKEDD